MLHGDDIFYVPPVLDPLLADRHQGPTPRSYTPHSCPTVRPSAEEAEALDVFEAALREDEYSARLENVAAVFACQVRPGREGDL